MLFELAASELKLKKKSANVESDIYSGYPTDEDKFVGVQNLRQYGNYTCGTTCVQMLMNYLYPRDYHENLGTTPEHGTSP